jgi:aldose sugar dehydrogenase
MMIRAAILAASVVASTVPIVSTAAALPPNTKVETYKTNLNFPVDMAWVPGTKRIFFTEKSSGRIRILDGRTLRSHPCTTLDVNSQGERGLLGITLHPNYKQNRYLYVYYSNASPLENRVTRFTVRDRRCRNATHIVKGIPASSRVHHGGQIEFAGEKLYVSTGEQGNRDAAQDTDSRLGKILRYNANGSIPNDNPFNNAIWTYGHRNPFGLAHRPGTQRVFASENGPTCDDEFNVIESGRNYGWGSGYDCGTDGVGSNPKGPAVRWSEIIVPTDPTYYEGRMKSLSGDIYIGSYRNGRIHQLIMNKGDTAVLEDRAISGDLGAILDLTKGPGRWLYLATTNAIKRIVPE